MFPMTNESFTMFCFVAVDQLFNEVELLRAVEKLQDVKAPLPIATWGL